MLDRLKGLFKSLQDHEVRYLVIGSREDLIASKRASGRWIDLEDVRLLELDGDGPG